MDRIPVRQLRNEASQVVRRARSGERLVITVDGVPAAEIGPVSAAGRSTTIAELVVAGAVVAPRVRTAPPKPAPLRAPAGRSSLDVLGELREH
jgi:prevent-host-death family protein